MPTPAGPCTKHLAPKHPTRYRKLPLPLRQPPADATMGGGASSCRPQKQHAPPPSHLAAYKTYRRTGATTVPEEAEAEAPEATIGDDDFDDWADQVLRKQEQSRWIHALSAHPLA